MVLLKGQEPTPEAIRSFSNKHINTIIDDLILEESKRQFGKKFKIKITKEDIESRIHDLEMINKKPKGFLKKLFDEKGVDFENFKNQIASSIVWEEYLKARYGSTIRISPGEVTQFKKKWIEIHDKPAYRISEIVIYEEGNPEKARQYVSSLSDYLQKGQSFAQLAASFSQAPSKEYGGDKGWVTLDLLPKEARPMIAKLQNSALPLFLEPARLTDGNKGAYWVFFLILEKQSAQEHLKANPLPPDHQIISKLKADVLMMYERKEIERLKKMFPHSYRMAPMRKKTIQK